MRRSSRFIRIIVSTLAVSITLSACAPSVVQIKPPFQKKLRPGDGVKITDRSGTLHSGRIVYLDNKVLVIRTPRQTLSDKPVKSVKFGTSIPWETIAKVRVAGTLDSQRKLISNEEIRINRRTNLRRKLAANVGLLGLATSFLIGSAIQESIAPADPANHTGNHGRARFAFWSTVLAGTAASAYVGYRLGWFIDTQGAIERIERSRATSSAVELKTASFKRQEQEVFGSPITSTN